MEAPIVSVKDVSMKGTKVQVGDRVVAVNGKSLFGTDRLPFQKLRFMLAGAGRPLTIRFRPGDPHDVPAVRSAAR